ncbi:MAG: hypothetical protein J6V06_01625 [Clostridia bacterium]|nr:hypothetical protein [Clostridia bacterium]
MRTNFLLKIVGFILAMITPLLSFVCIDVTEPFDKEIEVAMEKAGGYIKGVCHAEPDYELITDANIGWFRDDIPFPYDEDGNLSKSYIAWKEYAQGYADHGIKIFGVTPYPEDFIEYGLDPRDPANKEAIQDIARFYVNDLQGIVGAFQVTNEMGVDRFTYPLTMEEARDFIGIQLEAMYPERGDILIGYNLTAQSLIPKVLPLMMRKYHKYCDYVGMDIYMGCFEPIMKNANLVIPILGLIRQLTGKPVILCEFGYIGLGEPKSDAEKKAILQQYGYNSEEEARANIDDFISNLPEDLRKEFDRYADETPEYRASLMFDGEFSNHLYCELQDGFGLYGFPHTPEGQAEFFSYTLPRIQKLDYVIGSIVYCWADSGDCYVCGQEECPVETKWGLVDGEGNPKPAYYAVQEAFSDENTNILDKIFKPAK